MNINNQNIINSALYSSLTKNIETMNNTIIEEALENINQNISKPSTNITQNFTQDLEALLSEINQPPTEDNIKIIKNLIQNNIPLTKENIQSMIKSTKIFKDYPIEKALFLIQNKIFPTLDNCKQLEGYISKDININNQLNELFNSINNIKDTNFLKNIFKNTQLENVIEDNSIILKDIKSSLLEILKSNNNISKDLEILTNNTSNNKNFILNEIIDLALDENLLFNSNKTNELKQLLNKDNNENLLSNLNNLDKKVLLNIQKELINIVKSNPEYNLKLKYLFDKASIIQNKFKKFDIENSSNEDLNEFFEDLNTISKNIKENISNIQDSKSESILKNLDNLNKNMEFMSNLKDSLFLQIPLNINNFSTTADIYVFSNKKNKNSNSKNNSGSALISLNLANLGKIEVYINKNNKDVSCQFRLENEESKNLAQANIYLLEKYLQQKNLVLKEVSFKNLDESFTLITKNIDNMQNKNINNIKISNFNAKA